MTEHVIFATVFRDFCNGGFRGSSVWQAFVNTRRASGASLPESANGGQFDRRVLYCLLIYIMLSGEGKYLKIIIYHHLVIYFVMFYTYDVSNRPIPGNIADEWNL